MSATVMSGKENDCLKYTAESSIGQLLDIVFLILLPAGGRCFETLIRCAVLGVSQGHSFSQRISVIISAKANVQRHQVGMISVRFIYVVKV